MNETHPATSMALAHADALASAKRAGRPSHPVNSNSPIIVHCHLRWNFVWQRPQQIFSRLAAHHPILFIEDPLFEGDNCTLRITEPHPNVVRVVPVLPDRNTISVDDQCTAILPMLKEALEAHPMCMGRFESAVQWFYSPMTAPMFLGQLDTVRTVYDCMDELANFRFAPADLPDRERILMARADVVFTGGYRLYEAKSLHHDDVHFFGCGVDVAHYGQARYDATAIPGEVANLNHPILGYFGVIDERLDYDLLRALATEFAIGSIVMVGPVVKVDPNSLPRLPNLHWLGQRAYDDLPALVKSFDVCLMPFAMNEATQYINPTKTLEYMAAAKPIVSTAVPDVVKHFSSIVHVARDADEFVAAAAKLCGSPDEARIDQGVALANRSSWDSIVAQIRTCFIGNAAIGA